MSGSVFTPGFATRGVNRPAYAAVLIESTREIRLTRFVCSHRVVNWRIAVAEGNRARRSACGAGSGNPC
jgi:hypothetical protein